MGPSQAGHDGQEWSCPAFQAICQRRVGAGGEGLQQASPPLIFPGQEYGQPHGSQPAALALGSGKRDAVHAQSPQLSPVVPEIRPDMEDKEKIDLC